MTKRKKLFITISAGIIILSVSLSSLFISSSVEGVYSGGKLLYGLSGGTFYIRFYDGVTTIYSETEKVARYVGPYEIKPNGHVDVYLDPVMSGDSRKLIFTVERSFVGGATVVVPDELVKMTIWRDMPWSGSDHLIDQHEVERSWVHNGCLIKVFLDKTHKEIRREVEVLMTNK